jgi:hypothetical protein
VFLQILLLVLLFLGGILGLVMAPGVAREQYAKTRDTWPRAKLVYVLFVLAMEAVSWAIVLGVINSVVGDALGLQPLSQDPSQLYRGGTVGYLLMQASYALFAVSLLLLVAFMWLYGVKRVTDRTGPLP